MSDDPIFLWDKDDRRKISDACDITKRRRQFANQEDDRLTNMSDFVSQKRDIFRVNFINNTISDQISHLNLRQRRKLAALQQTDVELTRDQNDLL